MKDSDRVKPGTLENDIVAYFKARMEQLAQVELGQASPTTVAPLSSLAEGAESSSSLDDKAAGTKVTSIKAAKKRRSRSTSRSQT